MVGLFFFYSPDSSLFIQTFFVRFFCLHFVFLSLFRWECFAVVRLWMSSRVLVHEWICLFDVRVYEWQWVVRELNRLIYFWAVVNIIWYSIFASKCFEFGVAPLRSLEFSTNTAKTPWNFLSFVSLHLALYRTHFTSIFSHKNFIDKNRPWYSWLDIVPAHSKLICGLHILWCIPKCWHIHTLCCVFFFAARIPSYQSH